jgi:serpin B
MSLRTLRGVFATAFLILAGCSDATGPVPLLTSLPRPLTDQEATLIHSTNAFTLALFQQASAAESQKNVFLSPLSASMALGMTLNGARSSTFDAMRTALQFGTMSQADINASYQSLISLLTGLDPTIETRIANSIWYRNTLAINPAFVSAGQDFFDAEVSALDFTKPTQAKATINQWVDTKTAGRISSIVDTVKPENVMFLINAIYFKANWRHAFERSATKTESFTQGSGAVQNVPMMHLEGDDFRGDIWPDGTKSVDLPYGNGAFTMRVYLPPDTSAIEHFISRLKVDDLMRPALDPTELQLWMPRLKLEYRRRFLDDLTALGMGVAFTENADFSGMTTNDARLFISDVLQQTFLSIDEEGTEAAAVTKVETSFTSVSTPLIMRCNRPYLIVIREKFSGTIVFIGKINTI